MKPKKQQIKYLINNLKVIKKEDEKIDKAGYKYFNLMYDGSFTPVHNHSRLEDVIQSIGIFYPELSEMLDYLFFEVGDGDNEASTIHLNDEKDTVIKRGELEKYIINKYGSD